MPDEESTEALSTTSAANPQIASDPLTECLHHYRSLCEPGYAVLVTGPWGTGKTHQVRALLPEEERYYVSLFGPTTADEVHAAVLAAALPAGDQASEAMKAIEQMGGESSFGVMARAVRGIGAAILRRQLTPDRVLVFDDLERSSLPIEVLLGVINEYIEHRGFHVVLIAAEGEFDKKQRKAFGRFKEKLVGRTVEVRPQPDAAFDAFLSRIVDPSTRKRVVDHRQAIVVAFNRADAASLRVLRSTVDATARLLDILKDRYSKHPDLVDELVHLFAAFSVEISEGKLKETDFDKRSSRRFSGLFDNGNVRKGDESEKAISEAAQRHRPVDLFNVLLTNELLIAMLIHGHYDRDAILIQLDHDPRLVSPDEEPVWRVLWHHPDYPEDVLDDAARRMQEEFASHAFTDPGVMLHVFALRVRLARLGLGGVDGTLEEVGDDNLAYIDVLHAAGSLAPMPANWTRGLGYRDSYDGLGYAVVGDGERTQFERVYEHLEKMMKQAREDRLREHHGPELLRLVHEDPLCFAEAVCEPTGNHALTARHPVLATIDAHRFVEAWLTGERKGWHHVRDGLEGRYESGVGRTLLKDEREWLGTVIDELERRLDAAEGTWTHPAITAVAMPRHLMKRLEASDGEEQEGETTPANLHERG